ncbi:MAG: mannose-1-phosphate guanylyltransferase/mannose-6-phosphate isomerase [Candidatus Gastranaerophilales bacterium]|nr:mannose-1-phosphate guanylyltransferase/mannose-6-phosphate isomerase [Candidatus Gastranaerophilales bacterium]
MHGVILAGGSGSRLWPLSRELYPKQLLKINTEKSLLEATYTRLLQIMDEKSIINITNRKHLSDVKSQLDVISKNVTLLSEPVSKNTAPAAAVCVKYIMDKKGDDLVLILPSDHLIKDNKLFAKTISIGEKYAKEGYIVTFGITPSSPQEGYGYIKTGKDLNKKEAFTVAEFKEKPDEKTAKKYFKSGKYYWNSGIFLFKASIFMNALKEYAPEIYSIALEFNFKKNSEIDFMKFDKMPSISLDYAIMEHAKNIAVVPLLSDWNDLGCWESIYDISKKNKEGNVNIGNVISKDCKNSMLYSSDRLIAGVGLDNVLLVETADAVLVCDKNKTQEVKYIYEKLKEANNETHRIHTTVYRPWGYYTVLNQGEGYLTKMICVSPRGQLSLQSHNFRSEHWVVLKGTARVTLDNKTYILKPGSSIDIPVKIKHSLANPYDVELKIIEVQKGDKLVEEDIIRYKDIYGRTKA